MTVKLKQAIRVDGVSATLFLPFKGELTADTCVSIAVKLLRKSSINPVDDMFCYAFEEPTEVEIQTLAKKIKASPIFFNVIIEKLPNNCKLICSENQSWVKLCNKNHYVGVIR